MSRYEELRERCWTAAKLLGPTEFIEAVMAEVFRTLETVTPEMYAAAFEAMVPNHDAYAAWGSMLRASPLAPPKDDEP